MADAEGYEADDGFAFDFVGARDYRGFGYRGMADEDAFDFHGAQPVAGDFDYVVHAAEDPDVAVFVALRSVAGKIHAGDFVPVFAGVAFVVAVDGAEHGGPGFLDRQVAGFAGADWFAFHVLDFRDDAWERQSGRAGLCGRGTGRRGNQDRAGLRLPPSVHDGAAIFSNRFEIPLPRGGIDGFSHGAEQAKAGEFVRSDPLHAPRHESAHSGGRTVEDRDFVAVNNFPEAVFLREVWRAFVHHDAGAIRQRAIDDVAVAGDPADVRSAPVNVVLLQIENQLGAPGALEEIAAGSVQHAFGFSGGAAGVENVKRMFGIKGRGDIVLGSFFF